MARIFVSYSRKNIDFCKRLTAILQERELDFWVDWDGIPPTVDWMKEIQKGIEEADTFIFIISPDSITSKVCKEELALAVKNGKRLIPVVASEIQWDEVPAELSHLNYIFFRESDDFDVALTKLLTAIDTDYAWVQAHRRLQVKALEWERGNKDNGFLLRGRDLEQAEQQISINANKDPHPTDIQREYVLKSRQATDRQQRITTGVLTALIAVMLGIIALLAQPYVEDAIARAQAQNLSRTVVIPAGSVTIQVLNGVKKIDLPEFSIERHAVTNRVYGLCVKVSKCTPPIGSANFNDSQKQDNPIVWVTIAQAATYCDWVGRKLQSAAEWERAALFSTQANLNEDHFLVSDVYEWTSSYINNDSQSVISEWDRQIINLHLDWPFLQQGGILDPSKDLEILKNFLGAIGITEDTGFRCVNK